MGNGIATSALVGKEGVVQQSRDPATRRFRNGNPIPVVLFSPMSADDVVDGSGRADAVEGVF